MGWKRKISTSVGEYLGRDFLKKASDITAEIENWTSKNPLVDSGGFFYFKFI